MIAAKRGSHPHLGGRLHHHAALALSPISGTLVSFSYLITLLFVWHCRVRSFRTGSGQVRSPPNPPHEVASGNSLGWRLASLASHTCSCSKAFDIPLPDALKFLFLKTPPESQPRRPMTEQPLNSRCLQQIVSGGTLLDGAVLRKPTASIKSLLRRQLQMEVPLPLRESHIPFSYPAL